MILLVGTALAASVTLNPGDDVASLTSALGPGDEVVFNAGTYELESRVDWSEVLGTESSPVLIRGEGEVVLELVGSNNRLLVLSDSTFVTIEGLTIRGGPTWEEQSTVGLEIHDSADIVVQDCVIEQVMNHGIYLSGDNAGISIVGNELRELGDGYGIYAGCGDASCWTQESEFAENWIHGMAGSNDYAIALDQGGQDNRIADNVIYDVAYRGILVRSTEFGEPNVVEGNALWGIEHTALYAQGAAVVRNNLVFNTGSVGIRASDAGRGTYEGVVITHNTVVDTGEYGVELDDWAGKPGMVLANNAVSNPTGYAMYMPDGELDDDNYVQANVVTGLVSGFDELAGHFVAGGGDRDFVDAPGWDFYPSADSFLLSQGDPSSEAWVPPEDFTGAPRDGSAPDVGAYERVADGNPGWTVQEGFKELGYDDSDELVEVGGCCKDDGEPADALLVLPLFLLAWRRRTTPRG